MLIHKYINEDDQLPCFERNAFVCYHDLFTLFLFISDQNVFGYPVGCGLCMLKLLRNLVCALCLKVKTVQFSQNYEQNLYFV